MFASVEEASAFFEAGSLGYSLTSSPDRLDGLLLKTKSWRVAPFAAKSVYSSYFADEKLFPKGSVVFDHALIMRDIAHEWNNVAELYI